jgi:hypothetical protein
MTAYLGAVDDRVTAAVNLLRFCNFAERSWDLKIFILGSETCHALEIMDPVKMGILM